MGPKSDILVIDDDRDMVNSVRIILESKGYQVRAAYDGREGMTKIEEKTPDLIVLDVMMATDTEGFDMAYKLHRHQDYSRVPILMVTGFTQKMNEMGTEGFQHIMGESWPISHLLEKPIDPEELLSAVEALLREAEHGSRA